MPKGIVIIDWDKMQGPIIKLKYPESLEFNANLPMQVFMMHTSKDPPQIEVSIQVEDSNISSYFFQFKQKNTLRRIILMLLLQIEEPASDFFYILKNLESRIKDNIDNPKLIELIRDIYEEEILADKNLPYSASAIREKISERVKVLLDNKKFDEAQELLKQAEEIPFKLAEALKKANKILEQKQHLKAAELFQTAANLSKMIKESDLYTMCDNKAKELRKIPQLQNEIMELEEKAKKSLKKLLFNETIMHLEKASQIADELLKFETIKDYYEIKKNEFKTKVEGLMLYLKAHSEANAALKKLTKSSNYKTI
ncbi:MAG: hypothetical protein ACTSVY_04915 [Candidatus Helarchaeota archaeon]